VTPRRWLPIALPDSEAHLDGVILFDGVCVLCSRMVRFVAARDRDARFRFASVQGPPGRELAVRFGIDAEAPETVAVILDGQALFKSDAGLAILARLPRWGWAGVFRHLPRGWRDWAYDRVAGNRYRLFGRTEFCLMPSPDLARRFLRPRP